MRPAAIAAFVASLCLAAHAFGQAPEGQPVTGSIVNARGGEALANVSVRLSAPGSGNSAAGPRTVSDATGHFRLEALSRLVTTC